MPKRQREKTIPCDEVQGEDSWVVIRSPEYGLVIRAMEMSAESDSMDAALRRLAEIELGEELLTSAIVEWNWVDDDGKPLPQYGDNFTARKLSIDEVVFLLDAILGERERKNSS